METPKQLFDTRVNVFLGDAASSSPTTFAAKPEDAFDHRLGGTRDGHRDATGDACPDPDSASHCHGTTWEISYTPYTCVTYRLHVRLHAVEIETRQLAAHVAGVRAGRPPRSRLLAPSRRRRPRLADGRSPKGTREGVTSRARLGRREDGARHHGSGRVLRQRCPEALPGRGRVSAEDAGAKR